jgi:heme-degrading monooxygenase HmoA
LNSREYSREKGVIRMIARLWRGWATIQHAQAYEELFRTAILPGLRCIEGFSGAYVLCRDAEGEVEVLTVTLFASPEAIRAFAGADPNVAHVTPEARELLTRFEHTAIHYEAVLTPLWG